MCSQKLNTTRIKAPVREEMKEFNRFFRNSVKSESRLLNMINSYVVKSKGKEMRPMLVFLTAKLINRVTEPAYTAAALVQLLHTATLIHDDVVDEAYERRGFFSVNALWKSKVAVLVGDFLLAKGLLLTIDRDEFRFLKVLSEAVREMSEGELLQIEKSRKTNITEKVYFDIIYKKTATLIASCTWLGALSAGADEETCKKMKRFGKNLGIAFQLRDDLFDYEEQGLIGKPVGNDIKEKKITLPLIAALRTATASQKRWAYQIVKRHNKNPAKVRGLMQFVKEQGGLDYTRDRMLEYKENAMSILDDFPGSDAQEALKEMVNYTVYREK